MNQGEIRHTAINLHETIANIIRSVKIFVLCVCYLVVNWSYLKMQNKQEAVKTKLN
jgi:cbb3-type cytochrome oxidase subunit 3